MRVCRKRYLVNDTGTPAHWLLVLTGTAVVIPGIIVLCVDSAVRTDVEYEYRRVKLYCCSVRTLVLVAGTSGCWYLVYMYQSTWYGITRRFAPRAAYAARYARSGRKNTSNYHAKRTEVHD